MSERDLVRVARDRAPFASVLRVAWRRSWFAPDSKGVVHVPGPSLRHSEQELRALRWWTDDDPALVRHEHGHGRHESDDEPAGPKPSEASAGAIDG